MIRARSLVMIVTASLVALPSLASAQPLDPPDRFVVVRRDTPLYVEPKPDAHHVRAMTADEVASADGRWAVYRWVGELGNPDFVEIETLGDTFLAGSGHCHDGEHALSGMSVRLFVKTADLVTVVTRPIRVRYRDGSAMTVDRGVPVEKTKSKKKVRLPDLGVEIAAPKESIGIAYTPASPPERDVPELTKTVTGKLDRKDITIADAEIHDLIDTQKGTTKVVIAGRCTELTLVVKGSPDDVRRGGAVAGGVMGGLMGTGWGTAAGTEIVSIPAGTTVYHAGGGRAGSLSRPWLFGRKDVVDEDGRICWDQQVGLTEQDQTLTLCVDRTAVAIRKSAPPPPPPAKPTPKVIPATELEKNRKAGTVPTSLPASFRGQTKKQGLRKVTLAAKVCVSAKGDPTHATIIKASPWPELDTEIRTSILSTWRFSPYQVDGKPVAVCTAYAFNLSVE